MKWIIGCLLALFLVAPAMAGEDPYIAVVGIDSEANPFYFSPKHQQFLFDETEFGLPGSGEGFRCSGPIHKPEFCDVGPLVDDVDRGNPNCKAGAHNRGYFDWVIRLPKKPSGEINICIQCAVLKPNTDVLPNPIEICAAETGERLGFGFCERGFVQYGEDPIIPQALPTITAIAFPGPFNSFVPFYLTAYKNPGTYPILGGPINALTNGGDSQILDGSSYSRILLKACMDKCVVVKIPVSGQCTALPAPLGTFPPSLPSGLSVPSGGFSRTETELVEGDLIYVRLYIPNYNTVDIFCHEESASLRGVGESPN